MQLGLQKCTTMPALLIEMGVLLTFCQGWPRTMILPICES
jgi:hypothetical protein